jgi:nucleoside triphosphate pyrophosphatase
MSGRSRTRDDGGVGGDGGRRRFILASASPARLRLLRAAGLDPEVIVSGVDESAVVECDAHLLVAALAERKAAAVASDERVAGALVLGCDSILDVDGEMYGKPATVDVAIARWQALRGHTGTLVTGHCLIDAGSGERAAEVAATVVRFGTPSAEEIDAYMATGEPLAVAGGFTLDGLGAPFIDGIDGDPGNVIGVSLPLLRVLLARLGIGITSLWR